MIQIYDPRAWLRRIYAYAAQIYRLVLSIAAVAVCACGSLAQDLGPRPVFPEPNMARVKLGQLLFYDPILSGNRNIACATCHHPRFGTSDGVSLSLGEGAVGLGPERVIMDRNRPEQRLPRNAPGLWNLGAAEFTVFFHDGRLEVDPTQPNGIRTPLGADMTLGFQSALSAQAMFPVLSPDEMAGHYSENDIAQAVRMGFLSQPGGAWDKIAARVEEVPAYRAAFEAIAPVEPVRFTDIANVIADFMVFEWRADASPFDLAMTGGPALPPEAQRGMDLFYGKAGCSSCHAGWFQTDHAFHAIAIPQLGPGKAARFESHARDDGRMRVTGAATDAYAFRTPSLRNVTLTAPYGHSGAYADLEDVVRHHLDPAAALESYTIAKAILPDLPGAQDLKVHADPTQRAAITAASVLPASSLADDEIDALLAFLKSLEDPAERLGVPTTVPSGLPVDR